MSYLPITIFQHFYHSQIYKNRRIFYFTATIIFDDCTCINLTYWAYERNRPRRSLNNNRFWPVSRATFNTRTMIIGRRMTKITWSKQHYKRLNFGCNYFLKFKINKHFPRCSIEHTPEQNSASNLWHFPASLISVSGGKLKQIVLLHIYQFSMLNAILVLNGKENGKRLVF